MVQVNSYRHRYGACRFPLLLFQLTVVFVVVLAAFGALCLIFVFAMVSVNVSRLLSPSLATRLRATSQPFGELTTACLYIVKTGLHVRFFARLLVRQVPDVSQYVVYTAVWHSAPLTAGPAVVVRGWTNDSKEEVSVSMLRQSEVPLMMWGLMSSDVRLKSEMSG